MVFVLTLLPFQPLTAATGFIPARRHKYWSLGGWGTLATIAVPLSALLIRRLGFSFILSWVGLGTVALATAGTLWLLWWCIRRHYRTCDLTQEAAGLSALPAAARS